MKRIKALVLMSIFRMSAECARPELLTWNVGDDISFDWMTPYLIAGKFQGISETEKIILSDYGKWTAYAPWRGKNMTIERRLNQEQAERYKERLRQSLKRKQSPRPRVPDRDEYTPGQWTN